MCVCVCVWMDKVQISFKESQIYQRLGLAAGVMNPSHGTDGNLQKNACHLLSSDRQNAHIIRTCIEHQRKVNL